MADEDGCGEGIVFPGWLPEIWHVHAKLNWHFEIVGDDTFCQVLSEVHVGAFRGLCLRLDPKNARENVWEPNFDKFSFLFWFGRLREVVYKIVIGCMDLFTFWWNYLSSVLCVILVKKCQKICLHFGETKNNKISCTPFWSGRSAGGSLGSPIST